MKNAIKNRKGEGYIDTAVGVVCAMMVIVLALNVFSFLTLKQDLDYINKELTKTVCFYGKTGTEVNERYTLYVPVRFAGEIVYWTQIPLTVTSELTLKD